MSFRLLTTTLIASMAFGVPAIAQSTTGPSYCEDGFTAADTNEDDMISSDELTAARATEFDELDANGDGEVSRTEYNDCHAQWSSAGSDGMMQSDRNADNMASVDTNADGSITPDEYMTAADEAYSASAGLSGSMNTSADSSAMSDSDDSAMSSGMDEEPSLVLRRLILIPMGSGSGDGTMSPMSRDEAAARAGRQFQQLDANQDSQIDSDEWAGASSLQTDWQDVMNREFDAADTDSSDSISREEYMAEGERRMQEAQQMSADAGDSSSDVSNNPSAPVVYYRYPHAM